MMAKLNSRKLAFVVKTNCKNKLTHFFQKMAKKRGNLLLPLIIPIITNLRNLFCNKWK